MRALAMIASLLALSAAAACAPAAICISHTECEARYGEGARCVLGSDDQGICRLPCHSEDDCGGNPCQDGRCVARPSDGGASGDGVNGGGETTAD